MIERVAQKDDFRPPLDNPLVWSLACAALPFVLRSRHVRNIDIPAADWEHVTRLRDHRFILSANHPTRTDPIIAAALASKLGKPFNYVATRDVFQGAFGWAIQRMGAYSIERGTADRESISMTRKLLAEKDRRVVLFPEGEIGQHNDLTLPFHSGVTQMGFWAMADLVKLGKDPSLPIVPVAIKYRFLADPLAEIRARLARLELAVGLTPAPAQTWYERLVAIGEKVVAGVEREYRIKPEPSEDLSTRIQRVKDKILMRVATGVGIEIGNGPLPEQMRALFVAVRAYEQEFAETATDYDRRLHQKRVEQARPLIADLWRLHDCIAITGHYVRDFPTCERFSEVLARVEDEVLGRVHADTKCEALVRIAPPIDLAQWQADYKASRRAAVDTATRALEASVVGLLRALWTEGRPLPPEAGLTQMEPPSP